VLRVDVRDAWPVSRDATRSVGRLCESFDEFGCVIDGWERSIRRVGAFVAVQPSPRAVGSQTEKAGSLADAVHRTFELKPTSCLRRVTVRLFVGNANADGAAGPRRTSAGPSDVVDRNLLADAELTAGEHLQRAA
jgi:hypothetical protein